MANKRQKKIWFATYDFSNSGYVLMFQSFLFPLILATADNSSESISQTVWPWAVAASSALAICSAPFVGRLADRVGKARIFFITVVVTGLLASISPFLFSKKFSALIICFIVFNTFFELSQSLYDSFLLNFERTKKDIISLSSFGWGFGYVGGALFAILYLVFSRVGLSNVISLSVLGLLYLFLSIPSVVSFKKVDVIPKNSLVGIRDIVQTSPPVPWSELLIYWVIADSVAAVMYFAPLYMRQEIGISTQTLGGLFLGAQLLAFPLTVLMGKLSIRVGAIRFVRWSMLIWFGAVIGLYLARSLASLIPVMGAFSLVIGSTQAILRAHYASRVELEKSGEGLGYFAVAQKSASVIAPAMVGGMSLLTGALRPSFLLLASIIFIAFLLAFKLPESPASMSPLTSEGERSL
jgi:MFS transporter, UMF1 family